MAESIIATNGLAENNGDSCSQRRGTFQAASECAGSNATRMGHKMRRLQNGPVDFMTWTEHDCVSYAAARCDLRLADDDERFDFVIEDDESPKANCHLLTSR